VRVAPKVERAPDAGEALGQRVLVVPEVEVARVVSVVIDSHAPLGLSDRYESNFLPQAGILGLDATDAGEATGQHSPLSFCFQTTPRRSGCQ
jgi:hypothetical protein